MTGLQRYYYFSFCYCPFSLSIDTLSSCYSEPREIQYIRNDLEIRYTRSYDCPELTGVARLGYLLGDDCGWQSFPRLEAGRPIRPNGSVVPGVRTCFSLSSITNILLSSFSDPLPSIPTPTPTPIYSYPIHRTGQTGYRLSTHSSSTTPSFQADTISAGTSSSPAQCRETYRSTRRHTTFRAYRGTYGGQISPGNVGCWTLDARG